MHIRYFARPTELVLGGWWVGGCGSRVLAVVVVWWSWVLLWTWVAGGCGAVGVRAGGRRVAVGSNTLGEAGTNRH